MHANTLDLESCHFISPLDFGGIYVCNLLRLPTLTRYPLITGKLRPLLYISPPPVHLFAFDQYSVMVLADSITAATLYHHLVCAACVACSSRH